MEVDSSQRPVDGEEAAVDGHGFGRGSGESKVFKELEFVEFNEEVNGMLLDRTAAGFSGSSKDAQGDEVNGQESTDFEDDSVSEEVVVSDVARVSHRAVGNWMNGFELGDMVWGKVKSHPWWPGYLFNEALASSSVRRTRRDGHVLVAFFGDSSYGWFDPSELVPFDSHYEEKFKQTALRPFVKAVEEATDEASRREALGLACYCRNKYNFGPARVPGYFDVDIPGFEPWGIYSSKQVEDARKNFVPDQSLSFLKQLALCPLEDIVPAMDRIKNTAKMLAYRCSVFEEFDETYAQAFGVEPVRPPPLTGAMSDHPERFASRAAPLSGQLVMPEPLCPKKSSAPKLASAPKVSKSPSAKKNKYVLKRRDEQFSTTATIAGPPLPDFTSPTQPYGNFYNLFPTNQQPPTQPSLAFQDASVHGDYVLQKRAPSVFIDDKLPQTSPSLLEQGPLISEQRPATLGVDVPVAISPRKTPQMSVIEFRKLDPAVSGVVADAKEETLLARPNDVIVVDGILKAKKKIKKRLHVDSSSDPTDLATSAKKKIKKKRKEQNNESGLLPDLAKMAKDDDPYRILASRSNSIGPEQSKRADAVARATLSFPFSFELPKIDLSSRSLQLPELVADLHELALDPFYGIERDASGVALHVFLKFRSMVYQKSLALSLPSEDDAAEVQAPKPPRSQQESVAGTAEIAPVKTAKEGKEPTASAKPPKPGFRSDDPVVAGRKRTPSDRREDMSAKRQKKVNIVKALASEKKSAIRQKRNPKDAGSASTTTMPVVAAVHSVTAKPSNAKTVEPVKKQERSLPRVPCPTTLMMKFPPETTLPSIASLKARFARFGPLELPATRVYWKSYSCKVVYKFKPDAEAALNYARANEMFGQVKVHFYLRDADTQSQEPSADAGGQKLESRQAAEGVQFRPGSNPSNSLRPLLNPNHKTGQLKSILKKPGDDAGPTTINSSRETPRVKFMLDNVDGKPVMSPAVAGSSYSRSDAEPPPFSIPLESVINKTTKSGAFLPPPPPLPLSALHSYPSRTIDHSPYIPPPPVTPASSASFGLPPANRVAMDRVSPPPLSSLRGPRSADPQTQNYRQYGEAEGRPMVNKELANQMLSLMVRCSDIVSSVNSSLGYVPYHPL
ncbi:PWWP domain-containing protein 1-like [Curcuma longa]|uniref:PWWP domain-containing protein 1-like n=1 Tax=Curcuma longa TaxID=136217 RepID=UPI003D9EBA2D